MKIAVFVPHRDFFGNIITQSPFFVALREKYPNARIDIWSKVSQSNYLVSDEMADDVILYNKFNFIKMLRKINGSSYDMAFNLYPGSERVHLILKLSNIKETYSHSSKKWHKWLYKKHVFINNGSCYIANSHLKLLNEIFSSDYDTRIINKIIDSKVNCIDNLTLVPCGGAGEFKLWPLSSYLNLAKDITLKANDVKEINIILGPKERGLIDAIPHEMNNVKVNIYDTPNFKEICSIASRSILTVANDCGPMHMFQLTQRPLITLWGSRDKNSQPFGPLNQWFYAYEDSWALSANEEDRDIKMLNDKKVSALALAQINR